MAQMAELKKEMGCWAYYCSSQEARSKKLVMEIAVRQHHAVAATETEDTASSLRKGARLGKVLIGKAAATDQEQGVWKQLAELWTEVVVYAAPAVCELHVKAHKEALAQGGEFITMLWARRRILYDVFAFLYYCKQSVYVYPGMYNMPWCYINDLCFILMELWV